MSDTPLRQPTCLRYKEVKVTIVMKITVDRRNVAPPCATCGIIKTVKIYSWKPLDKLPIHWCRIFLSTVPASGLRLHVTFLCQIFNWKAIFREHWRGNTIPKIKMPVHLHHLESRWRNCDVLVYHGSLLSHLGGVAPSTSPQCMFGA